MASVRPSSSTTRHSFISSASIWNHTYHCHPHHPFSVRFSLAGPSLIHPRVAAAVPLAPCTFFLPVLCAILRVAHFPGTNARSLTPPPPPPAIPLNTTPQVSPSYNMSVHRICVGGRPYSDVPPCVCGRECVCSSGRAGCRRSPL